MTDEPEARELEAMTRGRDQALDLANRRHGEAIRAEASERGAVVRFLRDQAAKEQDLSKHVDWHLAADAIKRGDHMKEREG